MEAVGWDPLATLKQSVTLGMEHSYWPEVVHMPTLNQSVWPWGWNTLISHLILCLPLGFGAGRSQLGNLSREKYSSKENQGAAGRRGMITGQAKVQTLLCDAERVEGKDLGRLNLLSSPSPKR